MKYEVLTHACVRIEGSIVVYADPYKIEGAPHDADLVLITHSHFDHYSPEDLAKVSNDETLVITPRDMKVEGRSFSLYPTDQIQLDDYLVEAVPAYNIGKDFHKKENGWLGYVLSMDGKKFYIAGDTDATEEAKAVQCDVAFLPVGGTYTCDYKEAAELAKALGCEVIPYHYGSVAGSADDGEKFFAELNK